MNDNNNHAVCKTDIYYAIVGFRRPGVVVVVVVVHLVR